MRRGTAIFALLLISAFASRAFAAGPALVFEVSNSKVLFAENADDPWHPASLTKLMTAYLTFKALKAERITLKTKIPCSAEAHKEPPSKIGLPIGGELTVDKALQALIVKSANDVAVMLAEAVGGSQEKFIAQMNATAKKLGMTHTNYVNANGLPDPRQITTARDLAKLARAVINEFPEYAHYWSMPQMRIGKSRLSSHNGLLKSLEGADGLKTGFTCDSGFNIAASATRDGRQIVAVVLGDSTSGERNVRAKSLIEYGFQQNGWAQMFNHKTLDNMAYAPTVTSVTSVRENVVSWNCNPPKHKKKRKKKKKKTSVQKETHKKTAPAKLDGAQQASASAQRLKGTLAETQ